MPYQIIWSPQSLATLEQAVERITRDKPLAAELFRKTAHEAVDWLIHLPRLGSEYEAKGIRNVRELTVDPFRVFYRVRDSLGIVQIIEFRHSSRDEPTRADLMG